MSQFDDRERAFENRYALDQEQAFKALARRNRKLAQWAAEKLGLEDVDAYVREVVKADLEEPGDEDVIRKILADFDAKHVNSDEHDVRRALEQCAAEAALEIKDGV